MPKNYLHAQETINGEIIVDNFAGGGGASSGIELALGRIVNAAINHDAAAILMHRTNHPYTEHYQASVWDINPREVCRGRPYPKNEQVARCGNAVCPPMAAAVVRANFPEYAVHPRIETMAKLMEAVAV